MRYRDTIQLPDDITVREAAEVVDFLRGAGSASLDLDTLRIAFEYEIPADLPDDLWALREALGEIEAELRGRGVESFQPDRSKIVAEGARKFVVPTSSLPLARDDPERFQILGCVERSTCATLQAANLAVVTHIDDGEEYDGWLIADRATGWRVHYESPEDARRAIPTTREETFDARD